MDEGLKDALQRFGQNVQNTQRGGYQTFRISLKDAKLIRNYILRLERGENWRETVGSQEGE